MKYIFIILLSIGFCFNLSAAAEKLELKDQKDKESYSLGYQFGQNLKRQGVDINLDVYASGIREALGGKEPVMSSEEIRSTISALSQRVKAVRQKSLKEQATKNLSQGKAFLAKNGKKRGVKTLASGLQYKVLSKGSGKTRKASDSVTVHYRGTLINGAEFDSSHKRGRPVTFRVGNVIRGWQEALQLMKEGAKWQLFIPAELAYGQRAQGTKIPPNSTLIFEVELISIK